MIVICQITVLRSFIETHDVNKNNSMIFWHVMQYDKYQVLLNSIREFYLVRKCKRFFYLLPIYVLLITQIIS